MELEAIITELRDLARRKPLSKEDLERARELMTKLKEMGFTNKEISELTDGGWKEPTVKLYTRGSKVRDRNPKDTAISLLGELVDRGLTLTDVERAISTVSKLEDRGLSLEDVSEFLSEAKRTKLRAEEVLRIFKEMKYRGLSIEALREALAYRSELQSKGLTVEYLKRVHNACGRLGGYTKVFEAVEAYGDLKSIKAEVDKLSEEKAKLEREIGGLKEEVGRLEKRREEVKAVLEVYGELAEMGFDFEALSELKKASGKYGGLKEVLEAINAYESLTSLREEVSKVRREKEDVEAELKKLNADYAYLQTVIGMCDKLLYKYRFSPSAVERLYKLVKTYGEPIEVFEAVEKYGELKALEKEIGELSAKRDELKARVSELEIQIRQMRATADELRRQIKNTYRFLIGEITKGIGQIRGELSKAVEELSSAYRSSQEKLGKAYEESLTRMEGRLAEAGRRLGQLEEKIAHVKMLSTITDIIERTAEAKQPVSEVLTVSLPFIHGLMQYIEINKDKIESHYGLIDPLRKLSEEIIKRLRVSK